MRRRRLPRSIERELAKFLLTVGFKDYGSRLWNLNVENQARPVVGPPLNPTFYRQIIAQSRHDPALLAVGEEGLGRLHRAKRNLMNARRTSATKLLDGLSAPPAAVLLTARIDVATIREIRSLAAALRRVGARSVLVVVTDETAGARATADFDGLADVMFWRNRFTGDDEVSPRHLALYLHVVGAPVIINLHSRLGLETIGAFGRALAIHHRLYAMLDANAPYTDIYHLRRTAPIATMLATTDVEAAAIRATGAGLDGPGIVVLPDPSGASREALAAIFGDAFDDARSFATQTVVGFISGLQAASPAIRIERDVTPFDVTVTIVFHRERELCVPALASLRDMIEDARRAGIHVEARALMDNPDATTRRLVAEHGCVLDDIREVSLADVAAVRNLGAELARGRFLAFLDGDDLWGTNWLTRAYEAARTSASPQVVWHPEALFAFYASDCERSAGAQDLAREAARSAFSLQQSSDAADFEPRDLLFENLWSVNAFASRELYLRFPFRSDDWSRQIGIEDWRWNLETLGHGVAHLIVSDTLHLIRIKEDGSLGQLHDAKALLPVLV